MPQSVDVSISGGYPGLRERDSSCSAETLAPPRSGAGLRADEPSSRPGPHVQGPAPVLPHEMTSFGLAPDSRIVLSLPTSPYLVCGLGLAQLLRTRRTHSIKSPRLEVRGHVLTVRRPHLSSFPTVRSEPAIDFARTQHRPPYRCATTFMLACPLTCHLGTRLPVSYGRTDSIYPLSAPEPCRPAYRVYRHPCG